MTNNSWIMLLLYEAVIDAPAREKTSLTNNCGLSPGRLSSPSRALGHTERHETQRSLGDLTPANHAPTPTKLAIDDDQDVVDAPDVRFIANGFPSQT